MTCSLSQKSIKSIIKKTNYKKDDNFQIILIKQVKFAPESEWSWIEENPDLFVDFRQARISDFLRRKMDHQRMEKLFAPIFDENHRIKMWNLIFSK